MVPFKKRYGVVFNSTLTDFDDFQAACEFYLECDPRVTWLHYFRQSKGAICEPVRVAFVQYVDVPGYDDLLNTLDVKEFSLEDYELEKGL